MVRPSLARGIGHNAARHGICHKKVIANLRRFQYGEFIPVVRLKR